MATRDRDANLTIESTTDAIATVLVAAILTAAVVLGLWFFIT